MRRIVNKNALGLALGSLFVAGVAMASPPINGAHVMERVFNDCPGSTLTTVNTYPGTVSFTDQNAGCVGFANLHLWRLSGDAGATAASFNNADGFSISADLLITGDGHAEAGLNVNPWWFVGDGRVNVRTTDGEIACFGGRMPFWSFTDPAHGGLHYVKGHPIHIEIVYNPNGLSMASPGTAQYNLVYDGNAYTSGPLPMDMGNPAEDPPYGLWGILNGAGVGGFMQFFPGQSGAQGQCKAEWTNIQYSALTVGVENKTWSTMKGLYR